MATILQKWTIVIKIQEIHILQGFNNILAVVLKKVQLDENKLYHPKL